MTEHKQYTLPGLTLTGEQVTSLWGFLEDAYLSLASHLVHYFESNSKMERVSRDRCGDGIFLETWQPIPGTLDLGEEAREAFELDIESLRSLAWYLGDLPAGLPQWFDALVGEPADARCPKCQGDECDPEGPCRYDDGEGA